MSFEKVKFFILVIFLSFLCSKVVGKKLFQVSELARAKRYMQQSKPCLRYCYDRNTNKSYKDLWSHKNEVSFNNLPCKFETELKFWELNVVRLYQNYVDQVDH